MAYRIHDYNLKLVSYEGLQIWIENLKNLMNGFYLENNLLKKSKF